MTRFATFWVEDGKIVAPVDVLRFDDTLYRMLGENLEALTPETRAAAEPHVRLAQLTSARCRALVGDAFTLCDVAPHAAGALRAPHAARAARTLLASDAR